MKKKINHDNCPVVIVNRYFKGRPDLVPGLYCEPHAKLIKWLSETDAQELEQIGIERSDLENDRRRLEKI